MDTSIQTSQLDKVDVYGEYQDQDECYVSLNGKEDYYIKRNVSDEHYADWPMYMHDPQHTGHTEGEGPNTLNHIWSYPYTEDFSFGYSNPIVADGKVYINVEEGVICLDAETSQLVWSNYELSPHYYGSTPTIESGRLYVTTRDKQLLCLNAYSGEVLWNISAPAGYELDSRAPTVAYGRVCVKGTEDDSDNAYVFSFGSVSGQFLWATHIKRSGYWSQLVSAANERVYAIGGYESLYRSTTDDVLYCLDAYSGDILWDRSLPAYDDWIDCPIISNETLYIVREYNVVNHYIMPVNYSLVCLDASTGDVIWDGESLGYLFDGIGQPVIAYDNVYVMLSEEIDTYVYKYYMGCFRGDTGELNWKEEIQWMEVPPAIADGKVYCACNDGIATLDASTGDLIDTYLVNIWELSSPAIADGKVYINMMDENSPNGTIYCLGENGAGAFPADWTNSDLIMIHENSGSDLSNYQILVELNASNFDFSKAQPDGADIRFAKLDGTLLDYWIEEWNSTDENATVWIKVPSIPASGTATIKMWYRNVGAVDASDGDAVFEFFDDFEDGDFTNNPTWEEVQCPYASITTIDDDHWIKLFRVGNCDSPAYKAGGTFDLSQSFAITYKLRLSSGDQTGGGFALGTNDGYVLYNIGLNTGHWNAAETGPNSWSSGFGYDTAKTKTFATFCVEYFENYFYFASGNTGLSRETNHNIKLIYTASNHNWTLFVDGEDKGSIIGSTDYDTNISEIHISGKSATGPGNGAYFDDIIVRKYTAPEPTITIATDLPPFLAITSPAPGITTHSPTITITGTASDPSGIASVTVNGVLASGAADWSTWSTEVALAVGENAITVIAKDTENNKKVVTLQVFYHVNEDVCPLFSNPAHVEVGGTFYRWYKTIPDSTISIDSNYLEYSQPDENGVFNVLINTSKHGITNPSALDVLTYSVSITKNGQTTHIDPSPFNFTLDVLPRNYSTSWHLGSTIGGGGGIIAYAEGERNVDFAMTTGNQDSILLMNRDKNDKGTVGASYGFEAKAPIIGKVEVLNGDVHISKQKIYGSQVNVDYENANDTQKLEGALYILTSTISCANPLTYEAIDAISSRLTGDLTTDYYESGVGTSCGGSLNLIEIGFGLESAKIGSLDIGLGFEEGNSFRNRTYPAIDSQEYLIQYVYNADGEISGSLLGNDIVDWGPSRYIDTTVIMGQDKNKVLYGKLKIKDDETQIGSDYVTREITYDYGHIADENIINPFETDDIPVSSVFSKFIDARNNFDHSNITFSETRGKKYAIELPISLKVFGIKLSLNPGIRMGGANNYSTDKNVIYNKESYALEKYAYDTHVQGSAEELTYIITSLLEPVGAAMEEVMTTIKDIAEKGKEIILALW